MSNRYPFHIEWSEEDQEYVATCPAFPGLSAFGPTEEEALQEGKVALGGFIETCEAKGITLPDAAARSSHSGKLQLRLSKTQHRLAAQMAEREGVSLNTFIGDSVTARVTAEQVARPVIEEMRRQFAQTRTEVASVMTVQPIERYTKTTRETVSIEHTVKLPSNKERRQDN